MRLDKAIIEAGLASRRQIKKLIRSQQIRVDGQAIQKPGQIVDSHLQDIRVAGQKLLTAKESYSGLDKLLEEKVLILKPRRNKELVL